MAFTGNLGSTSLTGIDRENYLSAEQYFLSSPPPLATKLTGPFFSKNELNLYSCFAGTQWKFAICPQVQLIRLINIDANAILTEWESYGSFKYEKPRLDEIIASVNKLSVDFVFINSAGAPRCVIELDGPEHDIDQTILEDWIKLGANKPTTKRDEFVLERIAAWERDKIKTAALSGANIPLRRVKNAQLADPVFMQQLQADVSSLI